MIQIMNHLKYLLNKKKKIREAFLKLNLKSFIVEDTGFQECFLASKPSRKVDCQNNLLTKYEKYNTLEILKKEVPNSPTSIS